MHPYQLFRSMKILQASRNERGFALVVAISMMVLLVLLALALLTLSSQSMRSSSINEAEEEARANARLALMMAMDQLQMTMGPDQRISARAESLAGHPAIQATVSAASPRALWVGAASSDSTEAIGAESKPVVWLLSGLDPQATAAAQLTSSSFVDREIILYDANSINLAQTGGRPITAGTVPVQDPASGEVTGAYAYFVDDEGLKAQLVAAHSDLVNGSSDEERTVIPGSFDLSIMEGMDGFDGVPVSDFLKLNSVNDLSLVGSAGWQIARDKRMSFTTRSLGVLADVKHGGLKKDLTIAFEKHTTESVTKRKSWQTSQLPNMPSYPVFDQVFSKTSDTDWGDYLLVDESKRGEFGEPGYIHWAMLRDFYNLKRYIIRENGRDALTPVAVENGSMSGDLGNMPYRRGIVPPHELGPPSVMTLNASQNFHDYLPYGDFWVNPNMDDQISDEYCEYYKHAHVTSILGEMQYNAWLEKVPASPTDNGRPPNPKKPTTTEALRTNVQCWFSHYNPYNISLRFGGERGRFSFAANYMPQILFRIDDSIQFDGDYRSIVSSYDGHTLLQGFEERNRDRRYEVQEGIEYLGPGRAMMASHEADRRATSSSYDDVSTAKEFGTNISELVTVKLLKDLNIDGSLPPSSLAWDVIMVDNGIFHHGIRNKDGPKVNGCQFLWDPFPKNYRTNWLLYDDLPPSNYTDNVRFCFNFQLRTTKDPGSSIRPLVDTNIRALYFNRRWDTPLGLDTLAAYRIIDNQQDESMGRVPQMSPQGNGQGYGYWGAEHGPFLGHDRVILFDVPREDLVSLGQLQHANVGRFSYEPSYVIGNSYANPRIPFDQWKAMHTDTTNTRFNIPGQYALYDASYLVNEALWDGYIFTTIPQVADNYMDDDEPEPSEQLFASLLKRDELLPNPRFIPYEPNGSSFDMATLQADEAVHTNAGHLLVDGAFNVNSTSVDAWEAFLSGTHGMPYQQIDGDGNITGFSTMTDAMVRFPRVQLVQGGEMTSDNPDENYWVGFRALEQEEVRELAEAIVEEVKARGPFLSMAEFVNRKLENGEHGYKGALQAALDKTVNEDPLFDYDQRATHPDLPPDSNQAAGFPGQLLQGDILQALSPCMAVRSDTFTIRAYGESINPSSGEVRARAWCEATVQRYPDPIAEVGSASYMNELANPTSPFGRRFQLTSFRWLNPGEI